ncbi:MAG: response regulator [Acidobacteriota bacterium]|nr:response regulator [Acidobacteriota bacterium]MDQ5837208.1 response regulator [Acidobacteriota bacterium]
MSRAKVLIIDDEPSVADALKTILEDNGYEAALAPTGGDGLEQSASRHFHLTITDYQLPDMSGLDVLTAMRSRAVACPVIIITAYPCPELLATATARGALGVLPKPFLPSDILALVAQALAGSAGRPAE